MPSTAAIHRVRIGLFCPVLQEILRKKVRTWQEEAFNGKVHSGLDITVFFVWLALTTVLTYSLPFSLYAVVRGDVFTVRNCDWGNGLASLHTTVNQTGRPLSLLENPSSCHPPHDLGILLLISMSVERNPGPGPMNVNSNGTSTTASCALGGTGNDSTLSPSGLDQVLMALNQLSQSVHRIEQAQSELRQQQISSTASLQTQLSDVESSIKQRLNNLEQDQEDLRQDIGAASVKMEELEHENKLLRDRIEDMEQKIDQAENHSKRNNLLFYGIPTEANETWADCEEKVKKVIRKDMKVTQEIAIERAHRVGKAIIIKLLSYKDKETILGAAKNLATTNNAISVSEDFSKTVQQKRKGLMHMLKALRADKRRAKLRFDKLVTDDGVYTFDLSAQQVVKVDSNRRRQRTRQASIQPMDFAGAALDGEVWG